MEESDFNAVSPGKSLAEANCKDYMPDETWNCFCWRSIFYHAVQLEVALNLKATTYSLGYITHARQLFLLVLDCFGPALLSRIFMEPSYVCRLTLT
jgi:hypothetical protein